MPVLDTSVLVTYLLNEEHAHEALSLLISGQAHAPDIIRLECGNALITAARRGRILPNQIPERMRLVHRMAWTTHGHLPLLDRAMAICLHHQRRPYDGLFIALAERLDTEVITTDGKLFRALQGTPLAQRVRLLGEP
jgi:predicted nucleic acid-binding protein